MLMELIIEKEAKMRISVRGKTRQRIGVMNIDEFDNSQAKEILKKLKQNNQVTDITSTASHPTIERLIESFLVVYAFADKTPDGTLTKVISDVKLEQSVINWTKKMFEYHKQPMPIIDADIVESSKIKNSSNTYSSISSFSGGKDSTYIALEKNSLPVHIAKINQTTQTRELGAVLRLSEYFNKKPLVIPIINNLKLGPGPGRYHVRDALIHTLMLSVAYNFGARTIYTGAYLEDKWYSSTKEGVNSLNKIFDDAGLGVGVKLINDIGEEELIKRFIEKYPEVFEKTSTCIVSEKNYVQNRKWFKDKFPEYPLFEGTCGLCPKDTELNMVRLLHDPKVLKMPLNRRTELAKIYLRKYKNPNMKNFVEPELVERLKKEYT
jgi:hypothetical protein